MFSTPKSAYTSCLSPCASNSLARAGNGNEGITYKLGKLLEAFTITSAQNTPSIATLSRFKSEAVTSSQSPKLLPLEFLIWAFGKIPVSNR